MKSVFYLVMAIMIGCTNSPPAAAQNSADHCLLVPHQVLELTPAQFIPAPADEKLKGRVGIRSKGGSVLWVKPSQFSNPQMAADAAEFLLHHSAEHSVLVKSKATCNFSRCQHRRFSIGRFGF